MRATRECQRSRHLGCHRRQRRTVSNAGELVRYVHQTAPGLDETDAACRLSAAAHERFRARSEEPGTMRGVGKAQAVSSAQ